MVTIDVQTQKPSVAVIGVGTMGGAMAARLLACGAEVAVWSRHSDSTVSLVNAGATAHSEVTDAVKDADVVMTMLPTSDATTQVMFDSMAVDAMRPGAIWAQMATIGVVATRSCAVRTAAQRPDIIFVDAPFSGSRGPAESGQLLILASGPDPAARVLEPVFGAIGRKIMWLGPAGAGSRMKLTLNTWLAFQTEGAAEAASLSRVLDVDRESLFEGLRDNPPGVALCAAKRQRMFDWDFHPDFALEWALKDLELVEADAGPAAAPVAASMSERWRTLVEGGSLGLDVSAAGRAVVQPFSRYSDEQERFTSLGLGRIAPVERGDFTGAVSSLDLRSSFPSSYDWVTFLNDGNSENWPFETIVV